jgi:CMP/dCMP kinase
MAVITISRQFGCGGDEVADLAARQLGFRLFDKDLIAQAAREEGIADEEGIEYSEDSFKLKGFLDRLFGRERPVGTYRVWTEDKLGVRRSEQLPLTEEHALFLVQKAIRAACQAGNVIVVGRGGQALLRECPEVLHVRLQAPMEFRIQWTKAHHKLERRPAQDLILAHDEASASYIRHVYAEDWADPDQYHLVLNLGLLEPDTAARLIAEAIRIVQPAPV